MAQMRAFHTHDLAKIIQVVHSTVHNAVVLPAVVLAVHSGGQVITAFGGVKAAHLNGQMDPVADFAQCWRKVFGRGQCVGKIIAVKIRHRQPWAVFQFRQTQAESLLNFSVQFPQHGQLFLLIDQLFALGPDKVVNADKLQIRCFPAMRQCGEKILL